MADFKSIKITDTSGNAQGVLMDNGTITSRDYLDAVGEHDISTHKHWLKIGYTPSMTTTESEVWSFGGNYTFPSAAQQMLVVSNNNADIGIVIKGNTQGATQTIISDSSGSMTTLVSMSTNFLSSTSVSTGNIVLLDPVGATPEWGYVTNVSTNILTVSNGFSSGGSGSNRAFSVVNTNASTGALVIHIGYLDSSYNEQNVLSVLNGLATVPIKDVSGNNLTNFFRINSFRVIGAGSTNKTVGNLSLKGVTDGSTYSYILAGYTRARNAQYTVPSNQTLYIKEAMFSYVYSGGGGANYTRMYTRANVDELTGFKTNNIFYPYSEVLLSTNPILLRFDVPTKLPPKTDIKVSGISTSSFPATVVMRGWLEY